MKEQQVQDEQETTESLVREYLDYRGKIEALETTHKESLGILKETFGEIAAQLLQRCNEQNADSIKTPAGTVSRRMSSRYWTSDWEQMYQFIRDNDAPFLLEQRIHNGNMKQFLEENPDQMPIGLQADNKFVVQVRRPTNK